MLRITVHDNPRTLTFQLEGRLAGPCLRELEACWQSTLAGPGKPTLRVDLTGVTSVDAQGKACLAALYRQGAEFIAADCLTKAVVAEIAQTPPADGGHRDGEESAGGNADRSAEPEQVKRTYPGRVSDAGPQSQARATNCGAARGVGGHRPGG
jgi:hypothetical protein